MSVKFSKPVPLKHREIDDFFQKIGCVATKELRDFFLEYNGAKPENNIFYINKNNDSGVNSLIPMIDIIEEKRSLDNIDGKLFPVAFSEGGNYVVMNFEEDFGVYFWDHEFPHQLTLIAADINEFLVSLSPFNANDVELKDGQVESAWIDPEFLKSLQ